MNAQPWLKSYPAGVRWDAPLDIASVQSILDAAAERFGPLPALQFMDRRIPYAELAALANRAAAGLQKLGVGPGVHVGLYLPNTPHYVIAFFGVLKAGEARRSTGFVGGRETRSKRILPPTGSGAAGLCALPVCSTLYNSPLRIPATTNESVLGQTACGDVTRGNGIPCAAMWRYADRHD